MAKYSPHLITATKEKTHSQSKSVRVFFSLLQFIRLRPDAVSSFRRRATELRPTHKPARSWSPTRSQSESPYPIFLSPWTLAHTATALVVLSTDYNFLGLWHRPSGPNISALAKESRKKFLINKVTAAFEGETLGPRLETASASHRGSWPLELWTSWTCAFLWVFLGRL